MKLEIAGKSVTVSPSQAKGKGGEADIFKISADLVVKVFKGPKHPDLNTPFSKQADRDAAARRIEEHQRKLPAFPRGMPADVVCPVDLAYGTDGRVAGYTMRFIDGADPMRSLGMPQFKQQGVDNATVTAVFAGLHPAVKGIHPLAVIGDFNSLNILVLVGQRRAHIIDADSFQYGGFYCRVFTEKFVDPLLCAAGQSRPILARPHNADSDWYAFAAMLFESLLCVGPYGGVYRPKKASDNIPATARPLHRISVFDPAVIYPSPATPFKVLPDDLLHRFHLIFEKDERGEFPLGLITGMRWTTCTKCGTEHARGVCPECALAAPAAVKEQVVVKGKAKSSRVFRTSGVILHSTLQRGVLHWVYHENGEFRREDGSTVTKGTLDPRMRFRVCGHRTFVGKGGRVVREVGFPNTDSFVSVGDHLFAARDGIHVVDRSTVRLLQVSQ